jgi:hypothetical protein
VIIPIRFKAAKEFVDGLALVLLGDDSCYIDPQGRIVARDCGMDEASGV